jgi:gluconokinase
VKTTGGKVSVFAVGHGMSFRILIVMGVSGSGKSSLGLGLAHHFQIPFTEGDALHPAENVAKMSRGTPLTDEDRWPWLQQIRDEIMGPTSATGNRQIIACSALKKVYRDFLRRDQAGVMFLYPQGSFDLIHGRMQRRKEHFMKAGMLESQFATLEEPGADERDVVTVSIDGTEAEVLARAIAAVEGDQW